MHVQQLAACSSHLLGEHRPSAELDPGAAVAVYLRILQVSRPSKYHADWGVLLGPTTPDPTINTSMLSISSGDGTPLANGGEVRKPSNPNRLYISGLPYNWRTQHVSGAEHTWHVVLRTAASTVAVHCCMRWHVYVYTNNLAVHLGVHAGGVLA